jgi:type VI secretion system secreted protein VgrG
MTIKLAGENIINTIAHLSFGLNVGSHGNFTLHLANEDRSAHFTGSLAESSKKWIGKPLEVEGLFKGVVTSVSLSRARTGGSDFVINGHTPTIHLDDGIHVRSFGKKNLSQIVHEVLQPYESKFSETKVSPNYTKPMKYRVQYRESNFAFLNRLAARYGEWFYYDGLKLHFGKYTEGAVIRLNFERDLTHFNISMKTVPVNFKLHVYDYVGHDIVSKPSNYGSIENEYAKIAFDKSKQDIFPVTTEVPIHLSMAAGELEHITTLRQNVHLNELVVLSGSTSNRELKIGSVIEIVDTRTNLDASGTDNYGKYIITHITHEVATRGESYSNHFEAIPKGSAIPPLSISPDPPPCEIQEGVVMENNDPDGLGRVRVQFIWQIGASGDDSKTKWIRVASPQGGADKGFYIHPEKGDQVLVAFEHNHPEHPYVLTGMYHGKTKPEHHDPENYKKAIKTKGGHQILMNDEKGKETMALSSPTDFAATATGGKMSLNAKGKIIIKSSGGDIIINTPSKITVTADGDIKIESKADITIEGKNINFVGKEGISLKAPKINLEADMNIKAKATEITIDGSATTTVKGGANLKVEASGITSISGAMVKIN